MNDEFDEMPVVIGGLIVGKTEALMDDLDVVDAHVESKRRKKDGRDYDSCIYLPLLCYVSSTRRI